MNVQTSQHHTAQPPAQPPAQSPAQPNSGAWPVSLVVIGSLAVGALSALALALGVFPGATEAVVTGSLLLGFSVGWAALAFFTAHRTGAPQRWARVPASVMAVTGASLILWAPGDDVLAVMSCVWPALMLALVVWMFVQARRSMPGRTRWLLLPVFVVLATCAAGAGVQIVAERGLAEQYPAPGELYSVGDHLLHLDCRGSGTPTVVLFNGLGEFSGSWARVTDQVSTTARVCAYDRAGQGWSEVVDRPQDGIGAAADLHGLLAAAGETGPYVLVGHSIGGPYAMTYAAQYPADVAGMVLLDSSSPRQFTEMPTYPMQYQLMKRGLSLLPTLARVGLGAAMTPASALPGPAGEVVDALSSTVQSKRNGRDDLSAIPSLFEQSRALTTLDERPLFVLTASATLSTEGWSAAQDRLATLSSDSIHRTVASSHAGMVEGSTGSDASVAAITAVVHAVTTGSPLTTS